jgi:hypothetical protein
MTGATRSISIRIRLAIAGAAGALAIVGLGTALAVVQDDGGYASPARLQSGHGPAGNSTAATGQATETTGGDTYGSAALIQLGHGPGGPSPQR